MQKTRKCQQGWGDTNKEPERWSKDQSTLTENNDVIQELSSRAGRAKEAVSRGMGPWKVLELRCREEIKWDIPEL